MNIIQAIDERVRRDMARGLRMAAAKVTIAPASHLVGIDFGDGTTQLVNYSAALTLSVNDVVIVLADGRAIFAAFKVG